MHTTVIKIRKIKTWEGHVESVGEITFDKNFNQKPEGKTSLGRSSPRWGENVKNGS
jgi:hypothetical protein